MIPSEASVLVQIGTIILIISMAVGLNCDHHAIEDRIEGATIAGVEVPAVHCAEDEVIGWTAPDTLGCVHYEEVN